VGRKGQTAEEESKEHYPVTARGFGIRSVLGNLMESSAVMKPSAVAFSTSFLVMVERTQLVADDLAISLLVARCFTRIQHKIALGGSAREEEAEEIGNGGSGGNELINSTIPHYAIYISFGRRIVG
jgi:hypothetical protein